MVDLARISDVRWNYCDLKCLYLEKYYDYDFLTLIFSKKSSISPENKKGDHSIAECYIKEITGYYVLWN